MRHSQGKYLKTHDYIAPARAIIRTPLYAPIQWPWRAHPGNRAVARAPVRSRACTGTPAAAAPVHVPGPSELLRPCMFRVGRNCCARACSGSAGTAAPVHVQGRPEMLCPCVSRVGRNCCACACPGRAQLAVTVRRGPVVPPYGRDKYAVQSDHGPMRLRFLVRVLSQNQILPGAPECMVI